jgi:hypothetical protein
LIQPSLSSSEYNYKFILTFGAGVKVIGLLLGDQVLPDEVHGVTIQHQDQGLLFFFFHFSSFEFKKMSEVFCTRGI